MKRKLFLFISSSFTDTGKVLSCASSIVNHPPMLQRISTPEETSSSITIHNKAVYLLLFCSTDVKIYDLEHFQLKYELNHDKQSKAYDYKISTRPKLPIDILLGSSIKTTAGRHEKYSKFELPWTENINFIYATFIAKTNKILVG